MVITFTGYFYKKYVLSKFTNNPNQLIFKMKLYSYSLKICTLSILFFFVSCGDDKAKKTPAETTTSDTQQTEIIEETYNINDDHYVWAENINVRETPSTTGKVVGTYKGMTVSLTGEKSNTNDIIVLRGVVYDSPWYKVTTEDNKEGWIFGGTIKVEGEDVVNDIITDKQFDFPHFGKFDLSAWKNIGVRNEEAGDAETRTVSYFKDGKTLEISNTDVGEYGYYIRHVLKEGNAVLKERELNFLVDGGAMENRTMELLEIVKDYTIKKQFSRSQNIKKHFMELNAKPLMVNGTWEAIELKPESGATSELDKKTAFARPLEIIIRADDPELNEYRDGCGCTFRTHPKDYETLLVMGTYEDAPKAKAIIKIDGKYVTLKSKKPENPNYKLGDTFKHYYNDQYDLKFFLAKDGQNDAGGPEYTGTMHLTSKDGSVDTNINIFGGCGC